MHAYAALSFGKITGSETPPPHSPPQSAFSSSVPEMLAFQHLAEVFWKGLAGRRLIARLWGLRDLGQASAPAGMSVWDLTVRVSHENR